MFSSIQSVFDHGVMQEVRCAYMDSVDFLVIQHIFVISIVVGDA